MKDLYACDNCGALYVGKPRINGCHCGFKNRSGHAWYHPVGDEVREALE